MPRNTGGPARTRLHERQPLVSILLYETVTGYKRLTGENPSSVYVNKIAPLVALDLADQGVPLPLPFAWYLFGPEVMVRGTGVEYLPVPRKPDGDTDGDTRAREYLRQAEWRGPPPPRLEGSSAAVLIREKVDELLREYAAAGMVERLVDLAYESAPFEFQKEFRRVRMNRRLTGYGSALVEDALGTDLWKLVSTAFESFPSSRFPKLSSIGEATREVVNYAWNRLPGRDTRTATEAIEQFWRAFASYLRVDPLGHSHSVSKGLVEIWKEYASRDLVRLERAIGDLALRLAKGEPDVLRDETLGPRADHRRAELREGDASIDSALEDADELQAILAHTIRGESGG